MYIHIHIYIYIYIYTYMHSRLHLFKTSRLRRGSSTGGQRLRRRERLGAARLSAEMLPAKNLQGLSVRGSPCLGVFTP